MRTLPITEAKDRLSELVGAAEAGEEVVITRHGRPVVRMVAFGDEARQRKARAVEELLKLGKEIRERYGPVSTEELIAWKNEGRR